MRLSRLLLLAVLTLLVAACGMRGADQVVTAPDADDSAGEVDLDADAPDEVPRAEPTPTPEPQPEPTPTPEPEPDPLAMPAEGQPTAPDDPAAFAEIVTAAELAIRDPERAPAELAAAGHWQQVTSRALVSKPELVEPVLAHVPEHLHAAVRANAFAAGRLAAMHAPADPSEPVEARPLPAWRIVEPAPADDLLAFYREAEAASGVHWSYLAAINLVETRMGRIDGVSVAGAQGPMQFMPGTWGDWGEGDVNDPRDAILAAGRYLRWGGMPGDVNGALFRYNRDVRYVDAIRTYAEQMQADERAFYGYYHWQVYYNTGVENVWMPVGYDGASS